MYKRQELRELLDRLRPWGDERAVAREIRDWVERFWPPRRGIALGIADIAAYLRMVGPLDDPDLDSEAALGMTFHMLRNVWAGRGADQYDMLGDVLVDRGKASPAMLRRLPAVPDRFRVKPWPARTLSRYRRKYGPDALHEFLAWHIPREQDLVALVRTGRTLRAAERYLERHPRTPSMAAYPAPPARARRAR